MLKCQLRAILITSLSQIFSLGSMFIKESSRGKKKDMTYKHPNHTKLTDTKL